MERLRTETIDEYFFDVPVWDADGNMRPAPFEAVAKYQELKDTWLEEHQRLSFEIPSVALYPLYRGEKQGYVVATQIIYKSSF